MIQPKPDHEAVVAADARLDEALRDQGCRKRLKQATGKTKSLTVEQRTREDTK